MINLFEYQNKEEYNDDFNELELFLDDVWGKREKSNRYSNQEIEETEVQRFIQFFHKSGEIKSNKYVGVIHFEGKKINLLPKIFYDFNREYRESDIQVIHSHILWWLSYCRKIKFPNYQTLLGGLESDFFEILIYLFSKYTRELLASSIYQQYEEVSKELPFIKGGLNTNKYINENLSKGKWHKLNCIYDAFELDNNFNRIIKYVATLLFNASANLENKKYLREILFILDEVSDIQATAADCSKIQFNPIYSEYIIVKDYCELFLNHSISFCYKNDLKLFAFLMPMEYVFEDFVFGFIDKELPQVEVKPQTASKYLDVDEKFTLIPDLLLSIREKQIIADTKYKIVYSDEPDPKKGVSQNDLYQMLAYAVRFKIDNIIIFYPDTIRNTQDSESKILIKDELANGIAISVNTFKIPIINFHLFNNSEKMLNSTMSIKELFEDIRTMLKIRLELILSCETAAVAKENL